MPITQTRMLALIEEGWAFKEAFERAKKLTLDFVEDVKKAPPDDRFYLGDSLKMQLTLIGNPTSENLIWERRHFSKNVLSNDKERQRIAERRFRQKASRSDKRTDQKPSKRAKRNELGDYEIEVDPNAMKPEDVSGGMFTAPVEDTRTPEEREEDAQLEAELVKRGSVAPPTTGKP